MDSKVILSLILIMMKSPFVSVWRNSLRTTLLLSFHVLLRNNVNVSLYSKDVNYVPRANTGRTFSRTLTEKLPYANAGIKWPKNAGKKWPKTPVTLPSEYPPGEPFESLLWVSPEKWSNFNEKTEVDYGPKSAWFPANSAGGRFASALCGWY